MEHQPMRDAWGRFSETPHRCLTECGIGEENDGVLMRWVCVWIRKQRWNFLLSTGKPPLSLAFKLLSLAVAGIRPSGKGISVSLPLFALG